MGMEGKSPSIRCGFCRRCGKVHPQAVRSKRTAWECHPADVDFAGGVGNGIWMKVSVESAGPSNYIIKPQGFRFAQHSEERQIELP